MIYRIIRQKSNNKIAHIHTIDERGKYEYTANQDLVRFGYNLNDNTIEQTKILQGQDVTNYFTEKTANENQKKDEKKNKADALKQKLGLSDEEIETLKEILR